MIGKPAFSDDDILKEVSINQEVLPYQGIAFNISHDHYGEIGKIMVFHDFISEDGDATFFRKISDRQDNLLSEAKHKILEQLEPIIALQLKPIFMLALNGDKQNRLPGEF